MGPEVIYEDSEKQISIQSHDVPHPDMVSLLEQTIWGSGGTQYTICDLQEKIALLQGANFITIEKNGTLIGVYILLRKKVRIGDRQYPAYYRTFLALSDSIQGKGHGKLLVHKTRDYFMPRLDSEGLLYGYIEADNKRSLNVSKNAGYESIGTFQTTVFSRLRPRDDVRVRPLERTERETLVTFLYEQYAGHALLDFDQSVDVARYFVYKENHTIIAGVQVERCHWRICRLPGVGGFLLVHIFARVPGLRRLFDARRCQFLKLGNLYALPGREAEVFRLIEALLARERVTVAMAFQDPRSPVYQRLRSHGQFGLLNAAIDTQVHVMAAFNGFSAAQRECCKQMPLFISPLDIG